MTKYIVYTLGRPSKKDVIEAFTSFDARRQYAQGKRINYLEVVATRYNPPTTLMQADKVKEAFRDAVLAALDKAAFDQFGDLDTYQVFAKSGAGAWDQDLPELFKAIDRQAGILAERYYVDLVPYDPAEVAAEEAAALKAATQGL